MQRLLRVLDGFDRRLRLVEEWATAIMIGAIVIATAIGVFWRYALRDPLSWPNEFALFLFLWIAFLSASLVARDDAHFKIGFFLENRTERTQHVVNILLNVLKLFFLIVFIYTSIRVFPIQSRRQMTAVLGIHKGWHTFALTVGFTLMAISVLTDTLRRVVALRSMGES
jgi:TRAP-type C4-dicarboxylate transport system permease small subunit